MPGSHVVIYFNVYNNGNGKRRWMVLDDVTLMVCIPPTPTPIPPTPAPTNTPVPPAPPTATITPTTLLIPTAPEVILPDLQDPTERAAEALTTDLPARILRFLLKNPLLLLAAVSWLPWSSGSGRANHLPRTRPWTESGERRAERGREGCEDTNAKGAGRRTKHTREGIGERRAGDRKSKNEHRKSRIA